MHQRHRRQHHVLSVALALGITAVAPAARAWHDADSRITDDTAYTLPERTARMGLWKTQAGPWDSFTYGTYLWVWAVRVANLHAKWRFYHGDPWAFSVGAGLFQVNTDWFQRLDDDAGSAEITVVPSQLAASYRMNDTFTLSTSFVHTTVHLAGEVNNDDFEGVGEGAVTNLQWTTSFEWRFGRVLALVVHGRYLIFQRLRASGDVVLRPDEFTTIEVRGSARSSQFSTPHAWSVVPSLVWSWETFNLRAGLGYGNVNIPGVNFVSPQKIPIPELDLYWLL